MPYGVNGRMREGRCYESETVVIWLQTTQREFGSLPYMTTRSFNMLLVAEGYLGISNCRATGRTNRTVGLSSYRKTLSWKVVIIPEVWGDKDHQCSKKQLKPNYCKHYQKLMGFLFGYASPLTYITIRRNSENISPFLLY